MKIRHVLPEFGRVPLDSKLDSVSGIVRSALTIATRQAVSGSHAVQLFGLNRDEGRLHYNLGGVEIRTTRGWRWGKWEQNDWRYFLPIWSYALHSSVSVLHVHDNPFLLVVPRARRRLVHFHTPIEPRASADFSRAVLRADGVICNSEHTKHDLLANTPFPRDRVHVVHNAVDIDLFRSQDRSLKARLGIPAKSKVLLFVGQLSWEKGLIHLIHALQLMHSSCHTIVAGGHDLWQTMASPASSRKAQFMTPYEIRIREAAQQLPVHFLGSVATKDLKRVYAACDIFVCPSEWPEPFGMVNVEAMAAGKPVVASKIGGIPEIVVHGKTGLLVTPADPRALAETLDALLVDEEQCRALGEAGYKRVKRCFTWDRTLEQIEGIYNALQRR